MINLEVDSMNDLLKIEAKRTRYILEDIFFEDGDLAREKITILPSFSSNCNISSNDILLNKIQCPISGCQSKLNSFKEFESHYINAHKHQCSQCSRTFPSDRLLSIHLDESHDSYFWAMSKKSPPIPIYLCLVDGCNVLSLSDKIRSIHLRKYHKFPSTLCFFHPTKKFNKLSSKKPNNKNNNKEININMQLNNPQENVDEMNMDITINNENNVNYNEKNNEIFLQINHKKQQRKCRYYNSERGCKLGVKCTFLHIDNENKRNNRIDNKRINISSMEVIDEVSCEVTDKEALMYSDPIQDLSNCFESNTRISISSHISFGRRGKGRNR
jgi:hypothetical protein